MRRQRDRGGDPASGLLRVDSVFQHRSRKQRPTSHYVLVGVVAVSVVVSAVAVIYAVGVGGGWRHWLEVLPSDPYERALAILADCPVIDG